MRINTRTSCELGSMGMRKFDGESCCCWKSGTPAVALVERCILSLYTVHSRVVFFYVVHRRGKTQTQPHKNQTNQKKHPNTMQITEIQGLSAFIQ
jgi:hypothetical protein